MILDIDTPDGRRRLEIERAGAAWQVKLDGRTLMVDLVRAGDRWSLLIGDGASAASASFDVSVDRAGHSRRVVHVNGEAIPVRLVGGRALFGRRAPADAAANAGQMPLTAPMPGRVARVLVAAGDAVVAGQGLVVVEAMKMENELRAPRDGVVRQIRVAAGDSVEARAVLLVVE